MTTPTTRELLNDLMARRGWDADFCVTVIATYLDEISAYWDARPKTFPDFVAAVERRFEELESQPDVIEIQDHVNESVVAPAPPPTEATATNVNVQRVRFVAPVGVLEELKTKMGKPSDKPVNTDLYTFPLVKFPSGYQASLRVCAGPRTWARFDLCLPNGKPCAHLRPVYDRLDGDYTIRHEGVEYTLTVAGAA
jgi:hypothetical protein